MCWKFEYHQKLHHSQTILEANSSNVSLSTIRNYITLKLTVLYMSPRHSLSTIRNYITLKRYINANCWSLSLSTIRNYITLKPCG